MWDVSVYSGLFIAALGAATLLPMQSEALLIALIMSDNYSVFWLVAVASLGNVMGSTINWVLGGYIERYKYKRWFPVTETQLELAKHSYQRYGRYSLLLSWMPIIGDPLTVIAGVMKEPLWRFLLIVTLAKTARYAVLAGITLGLI